MSKTRAQAVVALGGLLLVVAGYLAFRPVPLPTGACCGLDTCGSVVIGINPDSAAAEACASNRRDAQLLAVATASVAVTLLLVGGIRLGRKGK